MQGWGRGQLQGTGACRAWALDLGWPHSGFSSRERGQTRFGTGLALVGFLRTGPQVLVRSGPRPWRHSPVAQVKVRGFHCHTTCPFTPRDRSPHADKLLGGHTPRTRFIGTRQRPAPQPAETRGAANQPFLRWERTGPLTLAEWSSTHPKVCIPSRKTSLTTSPSHLTHEAPVPRTNPLDFAIITDAGPVQFGTESAFAPPLHPLHMPAWPGS